MYLFKDIREQDRESVVNPIPIASLVVTDDHVDKTVMNPSSEAWMKGRDMLLAWTK